MRHCERCKENVNYCDTITAAREHARQGNCVAVDLGIIRRDNDLAPRRSLRGKMLPAQAALTRNEVHDHFKRVLAKTKWEHLRGLHALRHSFISACASKGVDQRLVQEWSGHMNEATSKRYRHLWPSTQQEAIKRVFG